MNLPGVFSDWIMPDKIHQLNVSFTVETLRREYGGTGGNAAYSLGLHHAHPRLVSRLGHDAIEYIHHLTKHGVDVEQVVIDPELHAASGHVMTDRDDNQIWSYFPGPLPKLAELTVDEIATKKDLLVLMPSEPSAFASLLKQAIAGGYDYLFDPAFFIPNLSEDELAKGIAHARIIIGNDYEIGLMEQRTTSKVTDWLKDDTIVITTLGSKGSEIRQGYKRIMIPIAKGIKLVDPTGAGDAYRAGFLAAYNRGLDLETAGRWGSLTAGYAVEHYGTQQHHFTPSSFAKRLKQAFDA